MIHVKERRQRNEMNVLPDYNPWSRQHKTFAIEKIPRFDRNNPIMSWGQKKIL